MSNADDSRRNCRNSKVVSRSSNGRKDYRGNYENGCQGNQWFDSRNRFQKDDRFNDRGYQFRNGGQKDDFSRGDRRNRGSSENFSRGDRRQMGRLNVLKVSDDQNDQTQSANEVPIKLSAICMPPGELPHDPILLDDTFTKPLWDTDKPGLTHVLYHEIDTGDNPPVSRPHRYDRIKPAILDYYVDQMLKEGTIIPIQSPYASPVVLCRKIMGYRRIIRKHIDLLSTIGNLMQLQCTPLSLTLIEDLIMSIPHAAIMSSLDLRSGYFQLALNPSDIVKTAFVKKNVTYAFRRMPFGLSGKVPNFQKAIDIILKPVIGKFVNVYMDDVIIASPSFTQHIEHLKEVFRLLQDAGLTLNKDKYKFVCDELKYLGLIINKEGTKTDETKVRAIVEMKPPRNSKDLSKFLGAEGIRRGQGGHNAKALVLKLPEFIKPFELFTDASSIGVGAVLNQEQRLVVFASRTLSSTERNYTVTEREHLTVVWTLNKFRAYLGSLPIKVITNPAALTRLTHDKNLSSRMIRWVLKLAEFNIEWEHRPGTQNAVSDVLSRNPVKSIIGEKVNCAIIRYLVLSSREMLIEEQRKVPELGHIYRYLENPEDSSVNATICENCARNFRLIEGMLFNTKYATSLGEMRVNIPKSLRNEIMREI
ncbi:retrovirus-related Pol polyprotein from transposon gypsy [Trichonephila clavipes]|nr:retrovirus-related Pol polyprotein from transposon gypsy [Trichonephila clavipes]